MAFVKAKREKVWLKTLLSGPSGSGKSYSALAVATGIQSKCGGSGIAYISSEGTRTQYYADSFDYDVLELADYSPESYMAAIDEAVESGYKVAIIDSISHEWQYMNDVHDKMPGNSFTNWGRLKGRHKAFMNKILQSPIHVVCCARGKTEWTLEDKNGKQIPKKVGMGSEQDKQVAYEFTVSLLLDQETHIASTDKDNTRLFDGKYEVLTRKHGEMLYNWANSGESVAQMVASGANDTSEVTTDADDITLIQNEIIGLAKALGGTKNPELMAVLKEYAPNGNPKSIKDVDAAQECLNRITEMNHTEE